MTIQIVPESAPFNAEQRAWLNGFLAGMLGVLDSKTAQGGPAEVAATSLLATSLGPLHSDAHPDASSSAQAQAVDDSSFPWHDPTLAIEDRMSIAAGKPKPLRLMAAMAQLDCGSCGYLCRTYAEAIASGTEKNLKLCSPGGNDTAKMIRSVIKEESSSTSLAEHPVPSSAPSDNKPNQSPSYHQAKIVGSTKLNGPGSVKDTRMVAIDLSGTSLRYAVGDALGVLPTNCDALVQRIIEATGISGSAIVVATDHQGLEQSSPVLEALLSRCLRSIPLELIQSARTALEGSTDIPSEVRTSMLAELDHFPDTDPFDEWDVLEFVAHFSGIQWSAQSLVSSLAPIRPRLYSIASSQVRHPDQVHLVVGRVENVVRDRLRKGVASTWLADRVGEGTPVQVYVRPSHRFTIPENPNAPMIMVGPGTGIAPFVGFLQQREADGASGKNWLFFGDQRRSCDYLLGDQLDAWKTQGLLTRLDLAFSRDSDQKIYVQHLMLEQGETLFEWLRDGGHLYVCGDGLRMAVDVDRALRQIVAQHGHLDRQGTDAFVRELESSHRYCKDVY